MKATKVNHPSLSSQISISGHNKAMDDFLDLNAGIQYQHPAWMYENVTQNELIPLLTITTAPNGNLMELHVAVTPLCWGTKSKVFLKVVYSMNEDLARAQKRLKLDSTATGIDVGIHVVSVTGPHGVSPCVAPTLQGCETRVVQVDLLLEHNDDLSVGASALHFVGEFETGSSSKHYQLVLGLRSRLYGSGWIEPLESILSLI